MVIKNPKQSVSLGLSPIDWAVEDMVYSCNDIDDQLYLLFWSECKPDLKLEDKIYVSIDTKGEVVILSDAESKYNGNSILILGKPTEYSYFGLLAFDIQKLVEELELRKNRVGNLLAIANACRK